MTPDTVRGTGGFSGVIYRWLFESDLSSHAKLLFCCLATYANTASGRAWPGQERLAAETGLSESTIKRAIKELGESGLLVTERRRYPDGRLGGNTYVLTTVKVVQPQVSGTSGPQVSGTSQELYEVLRETPKPPALALVGGYVPYTHPFAAFWEAYPRRNGKRVLKADAVKVWDKLTPNERHEAMGAVENYRQACDDGLTIAMDAVRWLRKHEWEAWDTPATPDQPRSVVPARATVADDAEGLQSFHKELARREREAGLRD